MNPKVCIQNICEEKLKTDCNKAFTSNYVDLTKSNLLKWTTLILKFAFFKEVKEEKEDL